jgi:hypothetical protein
MSLHDLADEFLGCWESGSDGGLFVRIPSGGGEFAVWQEADGRFYVEWLPRAGGSFRTKLTYAQARNLFSVGIPAYEFAVGSFPTRWLESLLPRFGLRLFGDTLVTADGRLFTAVTDVAASIEVLRRLAREGSHPSTRELVRLLTAANPGG